MERKHDNDVVQHVHCARCNKFYGDAKLFREHQTQQRCHDTSQESKRKGNNLFLHFNPSMLRMYKKESEAKGDSAKSAASEMEGEAVVACKTKLNDVNDGRWDSSAEAVGNANDCEPQAGLSPGTATPAAPTGSGETEPEIPQVEEMEEVKEMEGVGESEAVHVSVPTKGEVKDGEGEGFKGEKDLPQIPEEIEEELDLPELNLPRLDFPELDLPELDEEGERFLQEQRLVYCYICLKYFTGLKRYNEHMLQLLCKPAVANPYHGEWGAKNLNDGLLPTWNAKREDETKAGTSVIPPREDSKQGKEKGKKPKMQITKVSKVNPKSEAQASSSTKTESPAPAPVNPYSILAPLRLHAPKRKAPISARIWIRPTENNPIRAPRLTREYLVTMPGQIYNFPNENLLSPFEFQGKKCWLCLACCFADTFTPEPKPSMVSCACCRDRYHNHCVQVPETFRSPWYCRRCIVKAGLLDQAAVP